MLLDKIRRRFERIRYIHYLNKNHIKYSCIPAINGKIKIIHNQYLLNKKECYPNIELGRNLFINSGIEKNPIGRGDMTILRTIDDGKIVIGDNVKISNTVIVAMNEIRIGNDVMIGGGVTIWDTDFHSLNYQTRIFNPYEDIKTQKVIIDNGVFIGAGSYILKGVHIHDQAVIGAGSVVTKDVPSNEIWAGNPAKMIRKVNKDNDNS